MREADAQILVKSLLGRLARHQSFFELPAGRLSFEEVDALHSLLPGYSPESWELPKVVDVSDAGRSGPPFAELHLDLQALDRSGPPEEQIRMCLDFGTAMSKAWATGRHVTETLPLGLLEDHDGSPLLAVQSSVFISDRGRIYLGSAAETQHREHLKNNRRRFDNIKRLLSEVPIGCDLYALPLDPEVDPTGSSLSRGDLLLLYLAWLTDLSLDALERAIQEAGSGIGGGGDLRSVVRRFAIPCFEHAKDDRQGRQRAVWARQAMVDLLLRAQILADTLHGHWNQLTTNSLAPVMEKLRAVDVKALKHLLAQRPDIREPVAAGASRFDSELASLSAYPKGLMRRLLLVIDAGAGTTDFAVFQVIARNDRDEETRYALLRNSVRMSRVAGNHFDEILRPIILLSCGIDPRTGAPRSRDDFDHIQRDLDAQIRDIKRVLFTSGEVDVMLKPNALGRVQLADLSAHEIMLKCSMDLTEVRDDIIRTQFSATLLSDIRAFNVSSGQPYPISVLLTGGSAPVPAIHTLASGEIEIHGARFRFMRVDRMPEWIERMPRETAEQLAIFYPQSAVAIGGSVADLPIELDDMENPITPPPPGPRVLPRTQISGV